MPGGQSSPREFMQAAVGGLLLVRALGVAAELGVADLVADGPRTMADLAEATGVDAASLYRVLRMLGGHGVFAEDEQGRIVLTPRADILRADHPESMRESFVLRWQDVQWSVWEKLPEAVVHGDNAFVRAFGQEFFEYLAAHPEINAVFDRRMAGMSRAENPPVAAAYPFGTCGRILDIGGGGGGLLAAILGEHPDADLALFEQAHVLEDPADLVAAGMRDCVELIPGDFFAAIPAGFDMYMMKRVLHDWEDERALRILRNCRAAMAPGARIAVIDAVMRPGNDPDPLKDLDLTIMALTPGKERTEAEFAALFGEAGLRLTRIIGLEPPALLSIVEGEVA